MPAESVTVGYQRNRQIFSDDEEVKLVDYIQTASSIYFDLSPQEVRKFALNCALTYNITVPQSWKNNEMAGADWFAGFMKRHGNLSVRTPH